MEVLEQTETLVDVLDHSTEPPKNRLSAQKVFSMETLGTSPVVCEIALIRLVEKFYRI